MDLEILKNFVIPAIGAAAGFVSAQAVAKYKVEKLGEDFKSFKEEQRALRASDKEDLKDRVEKLAKEYQVADDKLTVLLDKKFEELREQIKEIDDAFTRFERASNVDFARDAEMVRFMEEENRLWQAAHRTLGQLEILVRQRKSSRPPPALEQKSSLTIPRPLLPRNLR